VPVGSPVGSPLRTPALKCAIVPPVPPDFEIAVRLGVASLAGLAIGAERERSGHATGPGARFAGVRTFFLLGLLSGLAGWLAEHGYLPLAVALALGATALVVVAFVIAARRMGDAIEGTTETAALVVIALGLTAGLGHLVVASGATAVVALALAEKSRIHGAIGRVADEEMRAAFQFGVLALVILPLLPVGPYGPLGGIRPRELWGWVLLFSGFSFVGYLLRRAVGVSRGYRVAGFLGGIVSSTVVTFSFARQSRSEPEISGPLAAGAVAASTIPYVRVAAITAVINSAVAVEVLSYFAIPLLVSIGIVAITLLRGGKPRDEARVAVMKSPLRLPSAIRLALALQIVLFVIAFVQRRFGEAGILPTAGLVGLTDVDALTLSMAKLGFQEGFLPLAAKAIAIGVLANNLFKMALALAMGSGTFRRGAGLGLLGLAAASALGLWFPLRVGQALLSP
jgi:uncharacterized membrane protein (DUF4010 family)